MSSSSGAALEATTSALLASTTEATAAAVETVTSRSTLATIAGFLPTALIRLISLATISLPLFFYRVLTWSFTLHLNFSSMLVILGFTATATWLIVRYRYLNKYSRLRSEEPSKTTSSFFDLHPDDSNEEDAEKPIKNYPDEFLSAFLSSIKIFGYLEQHVFHELARHLQTKKLLAGDTLFRNPDQERSFYIVVHGHVQLFVEPDDARRDQAKSDGDAYEEQEEERETTLESDDSPRDKFRNYTLINEVGAGGTLSSLFTILSIFRESFHREEAKEAHQRRRAQLMRQHLDATSTPSSTTPGSPSFADIRDQENEEWRSVFPNLDPEERQRSRSLMHPLSQQQLPLSASAASSEAAFGDDAAAVDDQDEVGGYFVDLHDRKSSRPRLSRVSTPPLPRKPYRSVHPNIVARATVDTTLAVIPEEAFHKLTQKFPKAAAHIVQVILTRFQRVTLMTGHRYLGLTKELLRLEKMVNDSASISSAPHELFAPGGMDRLRRKFSKQEEEAAPENEQARPTKTPSGIIQAMDIPSTPSIHDGASSPSTKSPAPNKDDRSDEYTVEDDEHLRAAVMDCLADSLGMKTKPSTEPRQSSPRVARQPVASTSETLKPNTRYYPMDLFSHAGTVDASASPSVGALSVPYDDDMDGISTISSVQSGSDLFSSHEQAVSSNDIQILYFPKDAVLVREGEHNTGLFFVIDGLLDVSMTPSEGEDLSLERNAAEPTTKSTRRKTKDYKLSPSSSSSSLSGLQAGTPPAKGGKPEDKVQASRTPAGREMPQEESKRRERKQKKPLFVIKPGGMAGYLASLTGYSSFVEIRAKTDTYVGYVSRKCMDRIIDKHPTVMLKLAKRLVGLLSPLILHIDLALEWMQVNAGQIICREGQPSDSVYIVLHGRLRTIREKKEGGIEIMGEFGHGDSVGELEALAGIPTPTTLHAIRDSELARMPKTLFNALSLRHPEITLQISRMVALRSLQVTGIAGEKLNPVAPELYGHNNANLKTIGILPVNSSVPVTEFAEHLKQALNQTVRATCVLLNSATITTVMGKHAFSQLGKLKLASWLAEQEEKFRIVLYLADSGVTSQWTRTCIRQADCILLVGLGDGDPSVGDYERFLINMKTTARKELVLLHSERSCATGTTQNWLKNRLWIQAHHHLFMPTRQHAATLARVRPPWLTETGRKMTENSINMMKNVKGQLQKYYSAVPTFSGLLSKKNGASQLGSVSNAARDDFARLARRLCGKSVALVLGGGGARGISHIGLIQALEEEGIPIDIIGGTSIGSFVGGLYAKNRDLVSTIARTKMFSGRVASIWRNLMDLTYPVTAWFTGHEFNRAIYKCFGDSQIEDFWLPYFAVTTNITWSRMEVHTTGYAWRYIRASMSLSGYIPPICENGNMLVDGGYMDNLPVSVAKSMGADIIIAVDVASEDDTSPVHYGDSISGWWALLYNVNPFRSYNVPSIAEIQSRLAYVSSVSKLQEAKMINGTLYIKLPVQQWGTLEFNKFTDIMQLGYQVGGEVVSHWRKAGFASGRLLEETEEGLPQGQQVKGKHGRRNSI